MPLSWPGSLPGAPQYGWSETPVESIVRTETDAGPAKTRRRFSSSPSNFSFQFSMTTAQATTLMDFYSNNTVSGGTAGGAMTFDTLTHPRTGLSVGTATTTNGWRFLGPPVITQDAFEHFRVSVSLELLG
mgnify:FL=1